MTTSDPIQTMEDIQKMYWYILDNFQCKKVPFRQFCKLVIDNVSVLKKYRQTFNRVYGNFIEYNRCRPRAGCIIVKGNRVLLVQAYKSKVWSFPSGKIEIGETPLECAVRETKEEVSFDVSKYIKHDRFVTNGNTTLYIILDVPKATQFKTNTREEIRQIKWFDISNILRSEGKDNVVAVVKKMMLKHTCSQVTLERGCYNTLCSV